MAYNPGVHFPKNRAYEKPFDEKGEEEIPYYRCLTSLQGNTCDIGTAEYNLALGERRANSTKTYLEGRGVSSSRISTISYGEEQPLFPNADEANRSKNCRDEFVAIK